MPGTIGDNRSGSWEFFDHAADVGIRVEAKSLETLFIAAGLALMDWMGPEPNPRAPSRDRISLSADGIEELLVRWLQELLYRFHQKHAYFCDAEAMAVSPTGLACHLVEATWDESFRTVYQEVKAVTYHQLRVQCDNSICRATIILDV